MWKEVFLLCILITIGSSDLYHEKSRIMFMPANMTTHGYFGYSVLLRKTNELIVGAPTYPRGGAVFSCSTTNMPTTATDFTCDKLIFDTRVMYAGSWSRVNPYDEEMWLGATLADTSNGSLIVCAPRWAHQISNHRLVNGMCYVLPSQEKLDKLISKDSQAFLADGSRPEYGAAKTHLNYFAYGQLGFSAAVSPDQRALLLGAPGVLQWTGAISKYAILPRGQSEVFIEKPQANPYYTDHFVPDSYIGYSIDAGVFELDGPVLTVAGAPRAMMGFGGMVVIFEMAGEYESYSIHALLKGSQMGEYFGASLCVLDLNQDGRDDLLVGAPTHVLDLHDAYDQGAVYAYITEGEKHVFKLRLLGKVTGSEANGAKFGSALASLGDVDGDGYPDVAIGAPWEDDGRGAVYIYRGHPLGLHERYSQRIQPELRGFGISISRGLDMDNNGCNDLAVGAVNSDAATLYRCIPSLTVTSSIVVDETIDLTQNATNFTANFCVHVAHSNRSNQAKIDLIAKTSADFGTGRALIAGDSQFRISVRSGEVNCKDLIVFIHEHADLSRPIRLKLDLKAAWNPADDFSYCSNCARLSDHSKLVSELEVQLSRDCGEDMICTPELMWILEPLESPLYVPGTKARLGARFNITNINEPSFGACIAVQLPTPLKRVPRNCELTDLAIKCDLPHPLNRNQSATWELELDFTPRVNDPVTLSLLAILHSSCENPKAGDPHKWLNLTVKPEADVSISKMLSLPNDTVVVTRAELRDRVVETIAHSYEIRNAGPSDWNLKTTFHFPQEVTMPSVPEACYRSGNSTMHCEWLLHAKSKKKYQLLLEYDLEKYGTLLSEKENVSLTTRIELEQFDMISQVTTCLVLEGRAPLWPILVGVLAGILLLAIIILAMYKGGFFTRTQREDLRKLKEESEHPGLSDPVMHELDDYPDDEHDLDSINL